MLAKVSVVIPCFNYGLYIREAIASAAAQVYPDVEIIVVDDGSTDAATRHILSQIESEGIRLIRCPFRMGVSSARNIGIAAASGAYILPLDADDKLDRFYLHHTGRVLETLQAEVAYTDTMLFGSETGVMRSPPFSKRVMRKGNVVVSTALFRKSMWEESGGYASALMHGFEDWDFWLSLLEMGARFKKIEKPLFYYRKHGVSRSTEAKLNNDIIIENIRCRHPKLNIISGKQEYSTNIVSRFLNSVKNKVSDLFLPEVSIAPRGKRPIKLHYFNPDDIKNFGDQLNLKILQTLSGRPVSYADSWEATHVCIGSMLESFHPKFQKSSACKDEQLHVLGTGFIAPQGEHPSLGASDDAFARPIKAHAVRGKLSQSRLQNCKIDTSSTVLGDPALLVSVLFGIRSRIKNFSLGIIPHYADLRDPRFLRVASQVKNSKIINVLDSPDSVIRSIVQCEAIISSSLHGLIVADSFEIPNLHVFAGDNLTGGRYKFKDYYSSISRVYDGVSLDDLTKILTRNNSFFQEFPVIASRTLKEVQNGLLKALSSCTY